jgi:hypothetical protein
VTALALIATWFSQNRHGPHDQKREELVQAIHRLPIYTGMALKTREQCKQVGGS